MAPRIVLFGATGYTGRLVAQSLVGMGERPVLAGRDRERLKEMSGQLGGLDVVVADAMRQNSVYEAVAEGDVIVSTVGPFFRWGDPAVRAAIAARAIYLDSTGEPPFIRRVFEEHGPAAVRAGAVLLTAMGYDYVPGHLAAGLALEQAGERATRAAVGYFALGETAASAGTKASLAGMALADSFAWRDGKIVTQRPAAAVRSFTVGGRERDGVSVGASEHFGLPAVHPRLRRVDVHLGWFGPLSRPLQVLAAAGAVARRVPGVAAAMGAGITRLAGVTPSLEPGQVPDARSHIVGQALDDAGAVLAEVHLEGTDPYSFTGGFIAWAARRCARAGVGATGALGPLEAFGLDGLREGCASAGLHVV